MKKLLAVVFVVAIALLLSSSALAVPSPLQPPLPYSIYIPIVEVPPCENPLVGGEVYATASSSIAHIGELVTVTGILYNNGCGYLGLPLTTVYPWGDTSVLSHTPLLTRQCLVGAVAPGEYCVSRFEFRATGSGIVSASVGASYEVNASQLSGAGSNPVPIRVIP